MVTRATVTERAGILSQLLDRLEHWWRRGADGQGIDMLSEAQRREIAHDLGLDPGDFVRLAALGPNAPGLLYARLGELGFTMEELVASGIGSRFDLERTCGLCADRTLCEHDLHERPEAKDWRRYCPNNPTFKAMEEALAKAKATTPGARPKSGS